MINNIINAVANVSLSKKSGRFLADKSYAFDTVFFLSKFILHNCENNILNKFELREKAVNYTEDIFQLTQGTAGAVNYFIETINFLEYADVLVKNSANSYTIKRRDILEYITKTPENAYIFNYLVTYQTFKNDGILPLFEKYCKAVAFEDKESCVKEIYSVFCEKSISIQESGTQWSKQLVKYALIVLGFINGQYAVTRELNVKNKLLTVEDISLNVAGTRTPSFLPKKNDYLQKLNINYIKNLLHGYTFVSFGQITISQLTPAESFAPNLADLKLTLLDNATAGYESAAISEFDKEQYLKNIVKTRNPAIQHQFRKGLFENNEHVCPICGFSFENFLIASHIKPYSKCDDTYDAINHFNGFLMCPNHDRLFEGAQHMTINAKTGEIILSESATNSPEYGMLKGKFIARKYIDCERRHYLKWHNERFEKLNQ